MSITWDPDQYHRYAGLRLRPALELFARISVEHPSLVHDIGTGGGEIARLAATRWPEACVVGSDSSVEMLEKARAAHSAVDWQLLDIRDWRPGPEHDLIYANAVLHWLPDHGELFPRLVGGLAPGGQLAVQMPMSWWQPSHQSIRATLSELGTAEGDGLAATMAEPNINRPSFYWDAIRPHVSALDIWETTYHQVLSGDDPVFEWLSGSILRPVFAKLPTEQLERFSVLCREKLLSDYPQRPDGTTLFPFHRLFIVATK